MRLETQFSIFLINRPGVLAEVTTALAKAKVNIRALSLADSGEHGVLRMVTNDPDKTRDVLTEEHDRWTETEVLTMSLDNTPGAFSDAVGRLAAQHVNISYAYATIGETGTGTMAVVKPADMNKAMAALEAMKG